MALRMSEDRIKALMQMLKSGLSYSAIISEKQVSENVLKHIRYLRCDQTRAIAKAIGYEAPKPNRNSLAYSNSLCVDKCVIVLKAVMDGKGVEKIAKHHDMPVATVRGIKALYSNSARKAAEKIGYSRPISASINSDASKAVLKIMGQGEIKVTDICRNLNLSTRDAKDLLDRMITYGKVVEINKGGFTVYALAPKFTYKAVFDLMDKCST